MIKSIGDEVRRSRKALGLTQEELAGAADCSPGMIALVENDRRQPGEELMERIATALKWSDELRADAHTARRNLRRDRRISHEERLDALEAGLREALQLIADAQRQIEQLTPSTPDQPDGR